MFKKLRQFKFFNSFQIPKELVIVTLLYLFFLIWFLGNNFLHEQLAGDWVRFWVPSYHFLITQIKEGVIPLWQPYSYMGVPGVFHPGYMIFYPPLWLTLALNTVVNPHMSFNILGKILELYLYAHYLIGGLSVYLLLRKKLKLLPIAAFTGGFIYIFSIHSVANIDPTLIGKMYLPLIIYLLLNFIEKRSFVNFLLLVGVNCILLTFGYPYYQVYFLYAQLLLALLYGFRSGLRFVIGFGLSGLISAYLLLPQAYYFSQAARITEASVDDFHTMFSPLPTYLINAAIPIGIYDGSTLFWGTIPLIFLITGFAYLKKDTFSLWLIITFLTTLVLGLGGHIGIQNVLGMPPFFLDKLRSHGQIFLLTFFTGSIILSYGINAALKGLSQDKITKHLWIFCTLIATVLVLIPFIQNNYLTDNRDTLIAVSKFFLFFIIGLVLYHLIVRFKSVTLICVVLLLTFFEFHNLYDQREPNKLGSSYNEYFARNSLIPEIPTKENLFRYEFWGNQFTYNTAYLNVFTTTGYDGIPYTAVNDIVRFPIPERYQFANVKYIVTTIEQSVPEYTLINKVIPTEHPQETIFSTADGFDSFSSKSTNTQYIYKVNNYLPRFYVPAVVRTCPNSDCYKSEKPPALVYTEDKDINIRNTPARNVVIKVDTYNSNTIILDIKTPQRTFIASSEMWDKGWGIKINEDTSTIYNVSNGFRGFIVDKGTSRVIMSYSPPFLKEGLMITLVGIVLLFLLYKNKILRKFMFETKKTAIKK